MAAGRFDAGEALFGQARGEAVLAVRQELVHRAFEALRTNLELEFVQVIEGRTLGFRPILGEDGRAEPLLVTLELAEDAKPFTLTGEAVKPNELPEGSRFRLQLRRPGVKDTHLTIIEMAEIARQREATLLHISHDSGSQAWRVRLRLRDGGLENDYAADAHTTVEVEDLAPKQKSADGASPEAAKAEQVVRILRGPWTEHGHRLRRGNLCSVEFVSGSADKLLRISLIRVLQRDARTCVLGWFTLVAPKGFEDREDHLLHSP